MKYMGSKFRFQKEILEIILKDRKENQWYVEPFAGGMNVISHVGGNRIANDYHPYLIKMWEALLNGWIPQKIDKDLYLKIKSQPQKYDDFIVGWAGFNCSYSGKWFGGFAGETKTKQGVRDYQNEAIKNVTSQIEKLKGCVFSNKSYLDLEIPQNSIIYCDPPYYGTTEYKGVNFNYDLFWNWVREKSKNNLVFVSEYSAPNDFVEVWSKIAKSSLSANGKIGGNKNSLEKLFVYENI